MMKNRNYPKFVDYLKGKAFDEFFGVHRTMTASEFLEKIPDAIDHFETTDRPVSDIYKTDAERLLLHLYPGLVRGSGLFATAVAKGKHMLVPMVRELDDRGLTRGPILNFFDFFSKDRPYDENLVREVR